MLFWTTLALSDLDTILKYFSEKDEMVAVNIAKAFDRAISTIEQFPEIGISGWRETTRELFLSHYPFVIVYRLKNNDIEIVRLLHTHQQWL